MNTEPFSLVVPTLDELESLPHLIEKLDQVIAVQPGLRLTDLIFVDDGSTDGTIDFIQNLQKNPRKYRVTLIVRSIRRGPANAELCGIRESPTRLVAKLDADGQHDVADLPRLLEIAGSSVDLVIASRYLDGGRTSWPASRGLISRGARFLSQVMLRDARDLTDPISGYFLLDKRLAVKLDSRIPRYKLVLYLLAMNPGVRVKEIPMIMRNRCGGRSKVVGSSTGYVTNFAIELLTYWRLSLRVGQHSVQVRHLQTETEPEASLIDSSNVTR